MTRILIVEDNVDLLSVLKQLLSSDYEVLTATRGEDAIEIARAQRPDLVILDLQLPAMDGIETGRWIKRDLAGDVAILVLTALAEKSDEETVLASGCCDAFMSKPAPLSAIQERVTELLQRRAKAS